MSKAIVYSGPACSWCERVKVLLQENDYEIEEKSITNKGNIEEFQINSIKQWEWFPK